MAALRLFSINGFLASLYFCLFSRRFYGEHHAVLKGRLQYFRDLKASPASSPQLRRNIHRLEKGLIMKPRRPVFGEAFIQETVQAFNRARATDGYSAEELKWAGDVLDEYFSVVEGTGVIDAARRSFDRGPDGPDEARSSGSKPYPRADSPATSISFDDLHLLYQRRRSVRWYLQQPVPLALIDKAVNSAALAPSACNRQPFRFIVSTEPKSATRIAECAGGTAGFAQQLPAIIVVVGDLSTDAGDRRAVGHGAGVVTVRRAEDRVEVEDLGEPAGRRLVRGAPMRLEVGVDRLDHHPLARADRAQTSELLGGQRPGVAGGCLGSGQRGGGGRGRGGRCLGGGDGGCGRFRCCGGRRGRAGRGGCHSRCRAGRSCGGSPGGRACRR